MTFFTFSPTTLEELFERTVNVLEACLDKNITLSRKKLYIGKKVSSALNVYVQIYERARLWQRQTQHGSNSIPTKKQVEFLTVEFLKTVVGWTRWPANVVI